MDYGAPTQGGLAIGSGSGTVTSGSATASFELLQSLAQSQLQVLWHF